MALPLDKLKSAEFSEMNKGFAWQCGTKDSKGRVLGNRDRLMEIPDRKIMLAESRISFVGRSVTEFGCLEGVHTIALCQMTDKVTALDYRDVNLELTKLRCVLYGAEPVIKKMNLELETPEAADIYFHSGLLYHLEDPAGHLIRIAPNCTELFLDTHYAKAANTSYRSLVAKKDYICQVVQESPEHPRSGVSSFARWLPKKSILVILGKFFKDVEVLRDEREKNGMRMSVFASGKPEKQELIAAQEEKK